MQQEKEARLRDLRELDALYLREQAAAEDRKALEVTPSFAASRPTPFVLSPPCWNERELGADYCGSSPGPDAVWQESLWLPFGSPSRARLVLTFGRFNVFHISPVLFCSAQRLRLHGGSENEQ